MYKFDLHSHPLVNSVLIRLLRSDIRTTSDVVYSRTGMSINRELIGFWYPLCHWAYMEYINDPQSPLIASTERRRHSSLKWNLKWPTLIIIHCTSVSPLSNQNGWRPPIHDYSTVPSQAVHPARNMSVYTLFIHPQRKGVRECHLVVRSFPVIYSSHFVFKSSSGRDTKATTGPIHHLYSPVRVMVVRQSYHH